MEYSKRILWLIASLSFGLLYQPTAWARSDTKEQQKRALLAHVHRVVVIPPFFGTDTLSKVAKPEENKQGEPTKSSQDNTEQANTEEGNKSVQPPTADPRKPLDPKLVQYAGYLRKLQDDMRSHLPQRLTKRAGFEIVPEAELIAALKELHLTPEMLFENNGRMKGAKFPLPLPQAIRDMAKTLHADAVALGVLDEPRRASGKYYFDPLYGFNYESGYAETHGGFYLMLPDGTEGLHGYMRVRIPLSKAGGRSFVLADWIDAQELMVENMMDEWTYYLPKR